MACRLRPEWDCDHLCDMTDDGRCLRMDVAHNLDGIFPGSSQGFVERVLAMLDDLAVFEDIEEQRSPDLPPKPKRARRAKKRRLPPPGPPDFSKHICFKCSLEQHQFCYVPPWEPVCECECDWAWQARMVAKART